MSFGKEERIVWISGHRHEFQKDDFDRKIDVYIKEPDVINEHTGIFLILEGLGGLAETPGMKEMRADWCNRYNVITLGVNYLGARSQFKSDFSISEEMLDKLFSKLTREQKIEYNAKYVNTPFEIFNFFPNQDLSSEIIITNKDNVPKEKIRDYNDFGYIQAMDCLYAIAYAINSYRAIGISFNSRRIFIYGSSFGGLIAQICSRFAPHTFSLVADASGYAHVDEPTVFPDYFRAKVMSTMIALKKILYYSKDPKDEYYFSPDMHKIRSPDSISHTNTYKKMFKGKIIMFHAMGDKLVNVNDKIELEKLYKKSGIDCTQYLFSEKDVDGEIIRSNEHCMGADLKKLFEKYCDKFALEKNQHTLKKASPTDFDLKHKITYMGKNVFYEIDYSDDYPKISSIKKKHAK